MSHRDDELPHQRDDANTTHLVHCLSGPARSHIVVTKCRAPWRVHDGGATMPMGPREVAMQKRPTRLSGHRIACAWCSREFPLAARGRIPKRCSQACRSARLGTASCRPVRSGGGRRRAPDRQVEKPVKVTVVERLQVLALPSGRAWPGVLGELAASWIGVASTIAILSTSRQLSGTSSRRCSAGRPSSDVCAGRRAGQAGMAEQTTSW